MAITRRDFIKQIAGAATYAGVALSITPGTLMASAPSLEISRRRFPRAFVFRQAEVLANLREYPEWEAAVRPLSGIVAKLVQDSRTDTVSEKNLIYATRFKQSYPEKMVLIHLNGNGRQPGFEAENWFAGWWLYQAGSSTTEALGSTETIVRVEDISRYFLRVDNFGGSWEDLVIAKKDSSGHIDFTTAEHVRLTAIDQEAKALHIQRGQYGSEALDWPEGSYIATHSSSILYQENGNKIWRYNLSTLAPRNQEGLHVIDAVIAGLQSRFAPGGSLEIVDGIEFDQFRITVGQRRGADADGDGVADDAIFNGVDTYTLGQVEFLRRVREVLGPDRFLIVDGGYEQRPDTTSINGVELEGVPSRSDTDFLQWSESLACLNFYAKNCAFEPLSYGLFKFVPPITSQDRFSRFRLALALSVFTNSAITFYDEPIAGSLTGIVPGPDGGTFHNSFTIWDEIVRGINNRPGWLGRPTGPTIHLAEAGLDLYENEGVEMPPHFIDRIGRTREITIRRSETAKGACLVIAASAEARNHQIRLPSVLIPGPDLTLIIDVRMKPTAGLPASLPRMLTVTAVPLGSTTRPKLTVPFGVRWSHLVLSFRRLPEGPITLLLQAQGEEAFSLRNIRIVAKPDLVYREFKHGAVLANPSDSPVTYDLAGLFPGRSFKRIRGHADQDPMTNSGKLLGATVSVPARDALLVASA